MSGRTLDIEDFEQRAASIAGRTLDAQARNDRLRLVVSMLDLTTLEGTDTPESVEALCRRAMAPAPTAKPAVPPVAAVCVYGGLVRVAVETLAGSSVRAAAVAGGFPSGQFPLATRLAEIEAAVADGAQEIDVVINRGLFLSGREAVVAENVRAMRDACAGATLKVILETGELVTADNVRRACDLVLGTVGESRLFLKTSTGKVQPAATPATALVMMDAVRQHEQATGYQVGIKIAGGVRHANQAVDYLAMAEATLGQAWLSPALFRFGASSLLDALTADLRA